MTIFDISEQYEILTAFKNVFSGYEWKNAEDNRKNLKKRNKTSKTSIPDSDRGSHVIKYS